MRVSGRTIVALIAALGVSGAAAAVILRIHSSRKPVDVATVLVGDLTAAALAVTLLMALWAWWQKGRLSAAVQVSTPSQAAAAADRLAEEMADRWRGEASRRRIVTPAPVRVRWRWAADEVVAPRQEVTILPAAGTGPPPLPDLGVPGEVLESGVVIRLHDEVYARLPHGRLVLLGGPGAGKTGGMILLLLAALNWRATLTGHERARVPVPVWLTLGRWDPATTTLQEWAASKLNLDHPALRAPDFGPSAAHELLRGGRVALFLDGLDEMPEETRVQALKRIGEEARGLRVVLTSRPEEYQHAAQSSPWDNTAVIELRPVRPREAADYLLHGQPEPGRKQWEQVGAYLTHNPRSVAAQTLNNPLTLSLARDTYTNKDPAELTDPGIFPTVRALREHLIDQVLVTAYPDEKQRAYATRWLAWIARNMGTSPDLPWWDIPTWIPRWQLRLTRVLVFGLTIGLLTWLSYVLLGIIMLGLQLGLTLALHVGFANRLADGLISGLLFGLLFGLRLGKSGQPRTLAPRWPRPRELRLSLTSGPTLAIWLTFMLLFGSLVGSTGPTVGLVLGLAVGLAVALRDLWGSPSADSQSATAVGTYRADLRTSMIHGLAVGLAVGLAIGLGNAAYGAKYDPVSDLGTYLVTLLVIGFPFGLAFGLATGLATGQVSRVKFTEFIVTCRRRERVRFLRLLEDAFDRQVLRQAGVVYQFRHAALQNRLAAIGTVHEQRANTQSLREGEHRTAEPA